MSKVHWNLAVSPDTDRAVRMFLATQGGTRKGDLVDPEQFIFGLVKHQ